MGNLNALGIQELTFGEQRALGGGGPLARAIGYTIGLFGSAVWSAIMGLDDFAWEFAEGFAEGFAEEYGGG